MNWKNFTFEGADIYALGICLLRTLNNLDKIEIHFTKLRKDESYLKKTFQKLRKEFKKEDKFGIINLCEQML